MSRYKIDEVKKLYISKFSVWNYDGEPDKVNEMILEMIDSSEGVYMFKVRPREENDFAIWFKELAGLIYYKEVSIEFVNEGWGKTCISDDDESVYYLQFDKGNKNHFSKYFKMSIATAQSRMGKEKTIRYLEKKNYIDNCSYDVYDFIFAIGDQVTLFTDIHDFTFVKSEEE